MQTKEEALAAVRELAAQGLISKAEVDAVFEPYLVAAAAAVVPHKRPGITDILYFIGGAIVFIGAAILVGQNWEGLTFLPKLAATFGIGLAAYALGYLLSRRDGTQTMGSAFYLIGSLVTPIGLYVIFDKAGLDTAGDALPSLVSGIMLAASLGFVYALRSKLFTIFSVVFGTWLYFSVTNLMIGSTSYDWKFDAYRILIAGLAYIALGYAFSKGTQAALRGFLYGFGALGVLGAALTLGGWHPDQSLFWELVYPVLLFGAFWLSVHLKSKVFLVWGTVFLMAYILKVTSEYFSSSLGWPLALMLAGLALIGAAYLSIWVKRRYLTS